MRILPPISVLLVLAVFTSEAAARKWTDSTGKYSIEAEFLNFQDGKVWLKKENGKAVSVPIDKLSKRDGEWVRRRATVDRDFRISQLRYTRHKTDYVLSFVIKKVRGAWRDIEAAFVFFRVEEGFNFATLEGRGVSKGITVAVHNYNGKIMTTPWWKLRNPKTGGLLGVCAVPIVRIPEIETADTTRVSVVAPGGTELPKEGWIDIVLVDKGILTKPKEKTKKIRYLSNVLTIAFPQGE